MYSRNADNGFLDISKK